MISYVLGAQPVLQFLNRLGMPAMQGRLFTKDWVTHQLKPTYFDPAGQIPRSNPIELDDFGQPAPFGPVYWEDDSAYFLELLDNNGNRLWSMNYPYIPSGGGGSVVTVNQDFSNLFINGQMRYWPQQRYYPIPSGETLIADGDWYFEKDGTNTSDSIEFIKFTPDEAALDASPVYYWRYTSAGSGTGETKKDWGARIKDVRSLSDNEVTLSAAMVSFSAGPFEVEVLAVQDFGTSSTVTPSAPVVTPVGTISLNTGWAVYPFTFTPPPLTGKTVGDNGDDYVAFVFRMPLNSAADIGATNFYLKRGTVAASYPYMTANETAAETRAELLPGPVYYSDFDKPSYNVAEKEHGYDVITAVPDNAVNFNSRINQQWFPPVPVGTVLPFPSDILPPGGYVMANGASVNKAGSLNRLYNVPFSGGKVFGEIYGSFDDNIRAGYPSSVNAFSFIAVTVSIGIPQPWGAGTTPFTFLRLSEGHANEDIGATAASSPLIAVERTVNGLGALPATDTSMVITVIDPGTPSSTQIWEITAIPAASISGGQYVSYQAESGPTGRYIYFVKDGSGTDPLIPSYIGRPVNIKTGMSAAEIGTIIARAIAGNESWLITCTGAALINPGEYFDAGALGFDYRFFYRIDGSRVQPSTGNLLPIDILSTDTAEQVAQKTADLLNPVVWLLPDWRGSFMRMWDDGRGLDPDSATRQNRGDGVTGDHVGTYQPDEFAFHSHEISVPQVYTPNVPNTVTAGGPNAFQIETLFIQGTGGNETRPKNYYFNFIIKY